jgi:Ni/Fe-hydrogenase subunit HybB-like protein
VTPAQNPRLIVTKAVLWFLVGVAAVVAVVRFARGLGVTTALTDATPWGMWVGFDVMGGVALAAGGFVVAATVYIFRRERYHAIVRPAILTAFLGYLAVIIGLMIDIGRPWNIWRPMFHWNLHSPLFEVAMCVMLYTTVLALEFAPVVLERFSWAVPIIRFLRRATLPLVILGIALSTLHQSSLGTLFLLSGARMHPLWFSPLLPVHFLVSAVGLGLGMVTVESLVTSWLYRREPEWDLLRGLARAATVVLSVYFVVRLGDLAWRGELGRAFDGSWFAVLFWVEMGMSTLAPVALFLRARKSDGHWAIAWGSFLMTAGFVLHRADVGGISHIAVTGQVYVPAPTEVAVSLGIVSGLGLIFLFFVENLKVWEEPPPAVDHFTPAATDPVSSQYIGSPWLGEGQRAALAVICGVVVGIALVEAQVESRRRSAARPIHPPRSAAVEVTPRAGGKGHVFEVVSPTVPAAMTEAVTGGGLLQDAILIDSGGEGRLVLFPHAAHQRRLGGEASCTSCHHRNVPLDRATSCSHCHRDMYRWTDTFDHARHVVALDQSLSCIVCHRDRNAARTRAESRACASCHQATPPHLTRVRTTREAEPGLAPGYEKAMHGLCLGCHREEEKGVAVADRSLSRCTTCHRDEFASDAEMRQRPPFAVVAAKFPEPEGAVGGGVREAAGTTGGSP